MFEYISKVKRYSIRILYVKMACFIKITRQNVIEKGKKGRKSERRKRQKRRNQVPFRGFRGKKVERLIRKGGKAESKLAIDDLRFSLDFRCQTRRRQTNDTITFRYLKFQDFKLKYQTNIYCTVNRGRSVTSRHNQTSRLMRKLETRN